MVSFAFWLQCASMQCPQYLKKYSKNILNAQEEIIIQKYCGAPIHPCFKICEFCTKYQVFTSELEPHIVCIFLIYILAIKVEFHCIEMETFLLYLFHLSLIFLRYWALSCRRSCCEKCSSRFEMLIWFFFWIILYGNSNFKRRIELSLSLLNHALSCLTAKICSFTKSAISFQNPYWHYQWRIGNETERYHTTSSLIISPGSHYKIKLGMLFTKWLCSQNSHLSWELVFFAQLIYSWRTLLFVTPCARDEKLKTFSMKYIIGITRRYTSVWKKFVYIETGPWQEIGLRHTSVGNYRQIWMLRHFPRLNFLFELKMSSM